MLRQWIDTPRQAIKMWCHQSMIICKGRLRALYSSNRCLLKWRLIGRGMRSIYLKIAMRINFQSLIYTRASINPLPVTRRIGNMRSKLQRNNLKRLESKLKTCSQISSNLLANRCHLWLHPRWHRRKMRRKRTRSGTVWTLPTGLTTLW